MKEILLDSTRDITIVNGNIVLSTTELESLSQRLETTLNAWEGEWILNINFGIPYRQEIFVSGATKSTVDAIFIREISSFEEITEIIEFTSEFNKITREYNIIRLIVKTAEGTVENVTISNPDDYVYTFIPPVDYAICQ